MATASFHHPSNSDGKVTPADGQCEEDEDKGEEDVEGMETAHVGDTPEMKLAQSGDSILDDSLSSSCDLSNGSDFGWSGYAADDSLSLHEFDMTRRDLHRFSFGPTGPPLLFPQLIPLVVCCLARACRETVNWFVSALFVGECGDVVWLLLG